MTRVVAGRYFRETPHGLVPSAPCTPDVIICRRVADFPGGQVPAGGAVVACRQCEAPIVYAAARHYAAPRICMQCANITPDPL
jgi:hypothetical protein